MTAGARFLYEGPLTIWWAPHPGVVVGVLVDVHDKPGAGKGKAASIRDFSVFPENQVALVGSKQQTVLIVLLSLAAVHHHQQRGAKAQLNGDRGLIIHTHAVALILAADQKGVTGAEAPCNGRRQGGLLGLDLLLQIVQGGVGLGVVRVKIGAQHRVLRLPLVQPVMGGLSTCHALLLL